MQFKQESLAALYDKLTTPTAVKNTAHALLQLQKKNVAVQSRSLSTRHGNADSEMDIGRSAGQE